VIPFSEIVTKKLGSEWEFYIIEEDKVRTYPFGVSFRWYDEPPEGRYAAKLELSSKKVTLTLLGHKTEFEWGGDVEALKRAVELTSVSLDIFRDPLRCMRSDKLLVSSIFHLNPLIWSDPLLVGDELANVFSMISNGVSLFERYKSFVHSIHFLITLERLPLVIKALKALATLGIAPPIDKRDLYYFSDLSPTEIKVITILAVKEAIDRLQGLDVNEVVSLLSEVLGLRSESFDRRRLVKSLSQRESKEGLTLSEISHILNMDKAYLWRSVLPDMSGKFLVITETDVYRNREVKIYKANTIVPLVNDLVLSYSLNLSYLMTHRERK